MGRPRKDAKDIEELEPPMETTLAEDKAVEVKLEKVTRKKRTPVGGTRDILSISELDLDPNYKYRLVLDVPGRLLRFREGGYEEVTAELKLGQNAVDRGSKLGSVVTRASGGGQTLVLMRIPKEWYDEDQKAKSDNIDAVEDKMRVPGDKADYGMTTITQGQSSGTRKGQM